MRETMRGRSILRCSAAVLLSFSVLLGCAGQNRGIRVESAVLSTDGEKADLLIAETRPGALTEGLRGSMLSVIHGKTGICMSFPLVKDLSNGRFSFPNHGGLFKKGDPIVVVIGKFSSAPAVLK